MTLYLNHSRARRTFKEVLGQANHLIITTLVGLDAVERRIVQTAPADLHAAWNPVDQSVSARRARRMVLDSVLIRAADALDVYLKLLRRAPSLLEQSIIRNGIDGAGTSVFGKLAALERAYATLDPVPFALGLVLIAWRNRSAHSDIDVGIPVERRQIILDNAEEISSTYRGLAADRLLTGFDKKEPTFKETASLIAAAHRIVVQLEERIFNDLDPDRYLQHIVWHSGRRTGADQSNAAKKKRMHSIWGRSDSRDQRFLRFLREEGISETKSENFSVEFDDALLRRISDMSPKDVFEWAGSSVAEFEDRTAPR